MEDLRVAALSLAVILFYRTNFIQCDTTPIPTNRTAQTQNSIGTTIPTPSLPTTTSIPNTTTTKPTTAITATTPTTSKTTLATTSSPSTTFIASSSIRPSTTLNMTSGINATTFNPVPIADSEETVHLVIIATCFSIVVLTLLAIIACLLWTVRHHLAYRILKNENGHKDACNLSELSSEVRSHPTENPRYVNSDLRAGNPQVYSSLDTHGASGGSPQEESYLTISIQQNASPAERPGTKDLDSVSDDSEDVYINVSNSISQNKGI